MSQLRARAAFAAQGRLPAVRDLIRVERPTEPMTCLRPHAVADAAQRFVAGFPGETMYAVKCNPDPTALRAVWAGGVRAFDCASLPEIELVRDLLPSSATIRFMHPVKSRKAIRAAWTRHGVRTFVLDHADELAKILAETDAGAADGLKLVVRVAPPASGAVYDLSGKFGATLADAAELLRAGRPHASMLGVSFHVGSQCLDPLAWSRAIAAAGAAIRASGVAVEVLDVGGGFPVAYPDVTPPPLGAFFAAIEGAVDDLDLPSRPRLWAEPGRALVACGASVIVQVQQRRGEALYVNDGVYGSLSDAGGPGFRFPAQRFRATGSEPGDAGTRGFMLFGPTCDSADVMPGPFLLPDDVAEGDWIEIGQLGAYGACLATRFNGFDASRTVLVRDPPMLSAA